MLQPVFSDLDVLNVFLCIPHSWLKSEKNVKSRPQSGWCYRKTWELGLFPVVYGRKNLGIIPDVFLNELLGNDARTVKERLLFWIDMFLICQQQLLRSSMQSVTTFAVYTFLRHINCGIVGNVPVEFVNEYLGNHSHGVREEFFLV